MRTGDTVKITLHLLFILLMNLTIVFKELCNLIQPKAILF